MACSNFFATLDEELSEQIHEEACLGPQVLNRLKSADDGEKYSCIVGELCEEKFSLQLVITVSLPKEEDVQECSDVPTLSEEDVERRYINMPTLRRTCS